MSAPDSIPEATLFDLRSNEPPLPAAERDLFRERAMGDEVSASATDDDADSDSDAQAREGDEDPKREEAAPMNDRKRIEEQLDALKRKELELRRALVVSDHPELAEAVRTIGSRAYAVQRAESKLAQGLSKAELRRREGIEKKLAVLRAKRAELEGQIGAIEAELGGLGSERLAGFESERRKALEQLLLALGKHEESLRAAGLEASALVPEIAPWLPELETIARELIAAEP